MGYSMALYLDTMLVIVALALIPFLKNREENSEPIDLEPVPVVD